MKNILFALFLFPVFSWCAPNIGVTYNCSWGHDYDLCFRLSDNLESQYFRFIEGGHLIELGHNHLDIFLEPTHVAVQGTLESDFRYENFTFRFLRAKLGDKLKVSITFVALDGTTLDPFDFECTIANNVDDL